MSQPFGANPSDLDGDLNDYVAQVFNDLQADILILRTGESMANLEQFQLAFEVLKRHTYNLTSITVKI